MKVILLTLVVFALANYYGDTAAASHIPLHPQDQSGLAINDVPAQDRLHWMRVANTAVYQSGNPCPQAPFGSAIVNTSSNELICSIANAVGSTGDPTLHGEITAIRECTRILKEKGQSPSQILAAWKDFSLYTNGEPCTMCASAIRWAGFKEVIYGSSIQTVAKNGRNQIYIPASYILEKSYSMGHMTLMLGGILADETDVMFAHQFNESAPCPSGCHRQKVPGRRVTACEAVKDWEKVVKRHYDEKDLTLHSHGHDEL